MIPWTGTQMRAGGGGAILICDHQEGWIAASGVYMDICATLATLVSHRVEESGVLPPGPLVEKHLVGCQGQLQRDGYNITEMSTKGATHRR